MGLRRERQGLNGLPFLRDIMQASVSESGAPNLLPTVEGLPIREARPGIYKQVLKGLELI